MIAMSFNLNLILYHHWGLYTTTNWSIPYLFQFLFFYHSTNLNLWLLFYLAILLLVYYIFLWNSLNSHSQFSKAGALGAWFNFNYWQWIFHVQFSLSPNLNLANISIYKTHEYFVVIDPTFNFLCCFS